MDIKIKRVYEAPSKEDGIRILVDRIWPRGLTKEAAAVDVWLKEVAPTTELRKWFGHEPAKWSEFRKRYMHELKSREDQLSIIKEHASRGKVTLVCGAKDEAHNQAVVLQEVLIAQ